jgi:ABC-2 type transport system permease protein
VSVRGHVLVKSVRDQRRALVGWSIGIVALVMVEGSVWPSIRDMPNFDELLESYPEAMREMFDIENMSTGPGFFNAELFTLVLPALFIIFGIARGARLVAGEEEAGTLEILLVTPLSTTRLLLEKAAAMLVSLVLLGAVCATSTLVASAIWGLDLPFSSVAVGSLAMVLLGLEYGWLALAVGAMTGSRVLALGIAGVAVVSAYVVYVLGLLVEEFHDWMPLSPFHQALVDGPLDPTLPARFGWLLLGAVVVLAVAAPVFARRDVRTA